MENGRPERSFDANYIGSTKFISGHVGSTMAGLQLHAQFPLSHTLT